MVSENNVDTWRRAAFFEESGETYKRVIAVCLRPLGQLAFELCKSVENPTDRNSQISLQLRLPTESQSDQNCYEQLNNFQVLATATRLLLGGDDDSYYFDHSKNAIMFSVYHVETLSFG